MEIIDHLFFYCVCSRAFWEEFESYRFAIAKEQRKLEIKTVLVGVTDTKCALFNYLIVGTGTDHERMRTPFILLP